MRSSSVKQQQMNKKTSRAVTYVRLEVSIKRSRATCNNQVNKWMRKKFIRALKSICDVLVRTRKKQCFQIVNSTSCRQFTLFEYILHTSRCLNLVVVPTVIVLFDVIHIMRSFFLFVK